MIPGWLTIDPTPARCHDCGAQIDDLEFVEEIDHFLCPTCLEGERN